MKTFCNLPPPTPENLSPSSENKVKIQDAGYLIQKSQQERRERTTERKANQGRAGQVGRAEDHL